ncbi:hypothetical protein HBH95_083670 [Parastagonospora nodorum]|nr:hypothetical protein HBH42_171920 [Parastagonospora nodorum]KAH5079768.1 hypothetical protein HBH95_083670 [Parastagonospora nodorum]KAH6014206.1 hypothetical protein HBI83_146610 [Parastagonospora nodorum]
MKFSLAAITALATQIFAQSITPAPTPTNNGPWFDGNPPPWATSDAARWSSIYASLVSDGRIPSTLTAAPWPTSGWGPGGGPWGPGNSGKPGGHWSGPPFGPSNFGPWSSWSALSNWQSAPWTAWWGGSACPPTDWPGWTAGPWKTNAPWTTWSACEAKTTATSVVTTTVNGSAVVSTQFGLQVAAASAESTGGGARVTIGLGSVVGVVVLGVAIGL